MNYILLWTVDTNFYILNNLFHLSSLFFSFSFLLAYTAIYFFLPLSLSFFFFHLFSLRQIYQIFDNLSILPFAFSQIDYVNEWESLNFAPFLFVICNGHLHKSHTHTHWIQPSAESADHISTQFFLTCFTHKQWNAQSSHAHTHWIHSIDQCHNGSVQYNTKI